VSHNVLFVGLTGAVGSGKSEVARLLGRARVPVFSTDQAGHRVLDSELLRRRLLRRYGSSLWGSRGKLDRKVLAKKVFSDATERRWLEGLIHPVIRREMLIWKSGLRGRRRPPPLAVVEVPLLFEKGWEGSFDGVLCVTASDALRHRRLERRGWDKDEIRRREKSQWPAARKARGSTWRVPNEGTLGLLQKHVSVWRRAVLSRRNA
jgi:dephospho-CoA kinase